MIRPACQSLQGSVIIGQLEAQRCQQRGSCKSQFSRRWSQTSGPAPVSLHNMAAFGCMMQADLALIAAVLDTAQSSPRARLMTISTAAKDVVQSILAPIVYQDRGCTVPSLTTQLGDTPSMASIQALGLSQIDSTAMLASRLCRSCTELTQGQDDDRLDDHRAWDAVEVNLGPDGPKQQGLHQDHPHDGQLAICILGVVLLPGRACRGTSA